MASLSKVKGETIKTNLQKKIYVCQNMFYETFYDLMKRNFKLLITKLNELGLETFHEN